MKKLKEINPLKSKEIATKLINVAFDVTNS
jgi:hypothetical protein